MLRCDPGGHGCLYESLRSAKTERSGFLPRLRKTGPSASIFALQLSLFVVIINHGRLYESPGRDAIFCVSTTDDFHLSL